MADTANGTTLGVTTTLAADHVTNLTLTLPTFKFKDFPGELFDVQQMASVDWDEIFDGAKLSPRAYTSWNALNILRLTLATWVLASHVAIVTLLLGKRALRTQPKNLLIVNVALANLLVGVFVVPVKLHFILNPEVVHCDLAMGWTFITHYFQTSLALWAVFSLVFERFVYVYTEKKQKNIRLWALRVGTVLLLVLPWVISLLFLLPTFFAAFIAKSTRPGSCLYKVEDDYFLACQILSFVPPSLGVFILAPFTGLLDCLRPSRCFYKPLTPKGESLLVTAVVSLFSIACEAPYCVVRVLMTRMECDNPFCTRFSESLTMAMWVRLCKAAIFPFIWLFYTDIRAAILCYTDKGGGDTGSGSANDDEADEADEEDRFMIYHNQETMDKKHMYPLNLTSQSAPLSPPSTSAGASAPPASTSAPPTSTPMTAAAAAVSAPNAASPSTSTAAATPI